MHDEFERAMTGRTPRKGLSPLGWFLAGAGLLVTVGIVGAGFVGLRVARQVQHRVERVTRQIGSVPSLAVANVVARLAQAPDIVSMDPERGLAMISDMADGNFRGDFLSALERKDFRMPDGSAHPDAPALDAREAPDAPHAPDAPDAPSASVVAADGRSLHIHSDEGDVSISMRGTEDGGFLTIDSDHGRVRFDLRGNDDGGHLTVSTEDGTLNLTLGNDAASEPDWVDDISALPPDARPVASMSSEDAQMGALAWKADEAPGEILSRYQGSLEDAGYEVRVRESFRRSGVEQASLWARNEAKNRMVFLVARHEHGRTGALLGFGEKR